MSDLSSLDRTFGLPGVELPSGLPEALRGPGADFELPLASCQVQPHEVSFRQLRGPREIARIVHLREEITLSAAALADASFATREKKETRWDSSALSCASARPSVPSVSCR
jgi:hypothetical protein